MSALTPTDVNMKDLWDTLIRYLKKCNRLLSEDYKRDLSSTYYAFVVVASESGVSYSVTQGKNVLTTKSSLEELAAWLKVYTSWEED